MSVVITEEMVWDRIPVRKADAHKGTCGNVLAVCGSRCYRGAAALCCMGALRSGAGLVTLASPEIVISSIASRIPEAIFMPLPEGRDEAETDSDFSKSFTDRIRKATVCAVGCGREENEQTLSLTEYILHSATGTVVLDAGGLCSLTLKSSEDSASGAEEVISILASSRVPLIITPHIGEMSRLTGLSISQIKSQPDKAALDFARLTGAVVVLKDHCTRIASPDGDLYENHTGNAGLARGGSGDVLTGIISGLAAQGLSALDAALCGVWLHGSAADSCAGRLSVMGMLPEDILYDLGQIFLRNGR